MNLYETITRNFYSNVIDVGRECYQFMSARPWQKIGAFYTEMVKGQSNLAGLFQKEVRVKKKNKVLVF